MYERRPHPCDGEKPMRIVKKFVTAHADLDGEIRMRVVKKFRDCACGLRSRLESAFIVGRAGRPKGRNRNAHRARIVAAVGMGERAWEKGKDIQGEKRAAR